LATFFTGVDTVIGVCILLPDLLFGSLREPTATAVIVDEDRRGRGIYVEVVVVMDYPLPTELPTYVRHLWLPLHARAATTIASRDRD
jgi:hypothetical protein